jgi:dTDP-4-dehydrorhamnose 3,5-epimerase|tara:strand:+ start:243 stop:668 length:426 start_codon:yes stop_codon:yes gene_type:complete
MLKSLPPVILTPLCRVKHPKGDVLHGMKSSDIGYSAFGEAYFTTIICGETKGWKKHATMIMNIVVPLGIVRFHLLDETVNQTTVYEVGEVNYKRLTIPPGYWVAFKGLTRGTNLILNIASHEHNPDESINVPLDTYSLTSK